ncbi:hypothetical protein [Sphingomonas sp. CFBP 13733]|uniref:hypothetical protein n=1 Tax=Sphingomonas sp. CFBP 13733 TaxID=2775291 RepID=UPI00177A867E|nr:hypothetical protein [Sphingomonas sp. CFBP 13733]MBD8640246.1 hypothetical protein [Sphingomonas sp. CFBP 13733]
MQGKYNMGGAGAIAFCGDRRFQLVASRRYDRSSPLGFTLLRRHPPELAAAAGRKNTWYEYLVFDGHVASVDIETFDIGLDVRRFETGSLLKLYSYRLPPGRSSRAISTSASTNTCSSLRCPSSPSIATSDIPTTRHQSPPSTG